jgi:hypothetical protein
MNTARGSPTVTLLGNGQVLVAGGQPGAAPSPHGVYNTTELYNPETGTWVLGPTMAVAHTGHTATLLGSGRVLVTGGFDATGTNAGAFHVVANAELYAPACTTHPGNACETALAITSVTGPAELTVLGGQYTPNPFNVVTTVRNNGTVSANDMQVTLYLPHGLAFATGSATQVLGTLAAGEERQVSWSVRATGISEDATFTYFVVAAASNAVAPSVARQITVPRLLNVLAVLPNIGGNAGNVTVTLWGSGFKDGAVVRLGDLIGQNTVVISPEQVQTTFDLREQSPGTRQIEIENPGGETATASEPFTIVDGGEEHLRIDLVGPSFVRVGTHQSLTEVPFYLVVSNDGLNDAEDVLIELTAEADPETSGQAAATSQTPSPTKGLAASQSGFSNKKMFRYRSCLQGTLLWIPRSGREMQISACRLMHEKPVRKSDFSYLPITYW